MRPLRIRPYLLLGDGNTWKRNDLDDPIFAVGAVVSVGGGIHNDNPIRSYLHLGILDRSGDQAVERMTAVMLEAIEFMVQWLKVQTRQGSNKSILVHCRGGMNRSPATIAAFLMATEDMSWEAAMEDIQRVRKKCRPRPEYKVAAERAVACWRQRTIRGNEATVPPIE